MSGPWEKYAPSTGERAGPWTKYAGAGDAGLSLAVTPSSVAPSPQLAERLAVDPTAASPTPELDAAGEAMIGSLARGASSLPLAMGGAAGLLHMPDTQDQFFNSTTTLRRVGEQLLADAQTRSKAGATAGSVVSILPQLASPALLAGQIVSGGTEPALGALDKGADVATAEKLMGVGTVGTAAANLIPVGSSANALVRALIGGGTNAGAAYLIPKAEQAVAPGYVAAPTAQDAIEQGGIGALLAAALGHGAPAARLANEARLQADPEIQPLPRGADFTARPERPQPTVPPTGGPVHVTPGGEAFTPAQGKTVLAQALDEALRGAPVGLPEPAIAVDRAGNAMTTADQHALATQPAAPAEDLMAMLGLTPDVVRAQARDPRRARDVGLPQLPAPSITVDPAGNAMTSADFLAKARAVQDEAEARTADARRKADLGLTPDIERTQAPRWTRQESDAIDLRSMQDAREAKRSELAQQGEDDSPPWWMAAHGADLDRAATGRMQVRAETPSPAASGNASDAAAFTPAGELAAQYDNGSRSSESSDLSAPVDEGAQPMSAPGRSMDNSDNLGRFMDGSRVVDKRGAPLTVYHGTNEEFSVFDSGRHGSATAHSTSPLGHFFTENRSQAQRYAENASQGRPADERVIDAYLSIKRPAEWTMARLQRIETPEQARAARRNLEASGFDGIHIKDAGQWIAFRPEQIKSASANRGTFDPANPDIRFSRDTRGEPQRSTGDGRNEASGIPAGLPIDATAETRTLSRALSRWVGAEGDDRTPTRFGAVRPDSLPDAAAQALDAFGQATGTRIVLVRNLTPEVETFNGVRLPELPGVLFVDESASHPFVTVAAHEFTHQLEQDNPALWQEIADEVRRQGRLEAYQENLRRRGYRGVDEDLAVRELVGDAVGDAFTDPEFLDELARRNPSVFQRVAQAFKDFLDRLISRVRDLGSSRYLQDVQAFRDKLADIMARYKPEFERPPGHRPLAEGEPKFSRRPGSENDHLQDMPSRRPGESQADYVRRVSRKSKDEIKAALALSKYQRDVGRLGLRAMWARQDRALAKADAAFAEYRKLFDKEDPAVNLRTIDQWENGRPIEDYDARQFFDLMKDAFDQRTAKIQSLAPDAMQQLIDNYFPHIWEDSSRALKWYQGLSAKRPLQGDRSFLKQRVHATIKDGMATGLKPVSTNPVDLAILKLGQMDKFIAFHEFRQDLERRGWLKKMKAGERVPVGYARVEDPAFQIAGGLQGYYAVPELIARDINNYLSPSLYRFGAWKALRAVQNVLMSSRLGLSMFHGGFTTMDNLVMHADVAGRRLMHGDIAGGIGTLLKTPLSIVWSPFEGGRLNKEWLGLKPSDQHTAAVLDMLEQGGAHMKMSATEYNNALPKLIRAVRQKSASGTLKQTLPAIGEAISWVIHHKLVPAQKMAARVMLAKFELDRLAGALGKERGDYSGIINALHPDALKQIAAHVVDLVDDRLGQMNYDNQFWNKTAREVAQAAIGAVGWQVGTLRTVTGGVRDLVHLWKPERLLSTLDKAGNVEGDLGRVSGRLSYLVTLALLMGGLSAITQYLLTGEGPSEWKDYFFPRTGNTNDDGSAERLQWPSYWSDHYKLATHPLQTAMHKVHPSIGMLMEALANQDYYGTQIRDPDANWWKQAAQVGEYLAKGFVPYSLTGAEQARGAGTGRQVANFFGLTKAPASVSRSRFEAFVAEKAYDAMPRGARSQAQAEHAKAMHDAEAAIRRGEEPSMEGLSPEDRRNVDKAARQEVPAIRFRRLSIEDKLRAYDLATPEERERYQLAPMILRSNWHKAVRDLPDTDREAVLAKIQTLIP